MTAMSTKMHIQTYNVVGENNQAANMYPPKFFGELKRSKTTQALVAAAKAAEETQNHN
jgi:hypothetical protein